MIARLRSFFPFLRVGLALGLSLGALFLALRQVSPAELRLALRHADGWWLSLALASVAANTLFKVLRWRILCAEPGRALSFERYLGVLLAGQALNLLYPARLGDLLRAQAIGEQGPGVAFVLGTLVAEKAFDVFAYGLLLVFLLVLAPLPAWLDVPVSGLLMIALACGFILGAIVLRGERLLPLLSRLSVRMPDRLRQWLSVRAHQVWASLKILRHRRALLALVGLTSLVWATAVLNNQLVLRALGLNLPPLAAMLLLVALQAGISLPAIPGSMGVFEYTCVLVLGLWQVTQETAFAYGLLLHVLVMFPGVLLGLAYLWRWGWASRRHG